MSEDHLTRRLRQDLPGPSDSERARMRTHVQQGLRQSRRPGGRRSQVVGALGFAGALGAGVLFFVMALPGGTKAPPAATTTTTRVDPGAATRTEAPARAGRWWLSPTASRTGRAAAIALGRTPKWVQATRTREQGLLAGSDKASFRDDAKNGLEVEYYLAFARWELDDVRRGTVGPRGTVWTGGQDAGLQSLYFLSNDGYGVWVGNHSSAPGGRALQETELLTIAYRFVDGLRQAGVDRSIPVQRGSAPPHGRLVGTRLRGVVAIPSRVRLRPDRPVVLKQPNLRWRVSVMNTGDTTLRNVGVVVHWSFAGGRDTPNTEVSIASIAPGVSAAVDVDGPPPVKRATAGVLLVQVVPVPGEQNTANNALSLPVTLLPR